MKPIYWTTQEGEKINIEKMNTSHMKNCLNFVNKKLKDAKQRKDKQGIKLYEKYVKHFTRILRDRNLNSLMIDEDDIGINLY